MIETAKDTRGTVPTVSGGRGRGQGVTRRAVFLGVVLVPLNVWWVTIFEAKWQSLSSTWGPIFATPIFILLCLVLLNFALKSLGQRWTLSKQELLVVYVMLIISDTVNGFHSMQSMMAVLPYPSFFASPENKWDTLFLRFVPRWLFVSDPGAVDGFYYGGDGMYHWRFLSAWLVPLAAWSFFMLVVVWVMICLSVMVRKQWTEEEKLTYPVIQLPLALVDDSAASGLFRNRLMWIGFGLAFSLGLINGLNFLYPTIPAIQAVKWHSVTPYFTEWPLSAMGGVFISMHPFMIGLAYFLPNDLAFSCWFFFVFMYVEQIGGAVFGWQDVPGFPFFWEQAQGSWIALALAALWGTRRHLKEVFGRAFGLMRGVDDAGEPVPYRWAVVGVFLGLAVLAVFTWLAGMTLWVAGAFFILYFLIAIAITRARAEFGAPCFMRSANPVDILPLIGTKFLSTPTLTVMGCYHWFNRNYAGLPMPNHLEAFKMAQVTGIETRGLVRVILLATVVAMIFTYWSNLDFNYYDGALVSPLYKGFVGASSFERVAGWIQTPTGPDVRGLTVAAVAFVFAFLLRAGRMRFFYWPFHPVGYALATGNALKYCWFCFFIAWLAKAILGRVGGNASQRAATPFFIGLMLGDFTIGIFWASLGAVLHIPVFRLYFA